MTEEQLVLQLNLSPPFSLNDNSTMWACSRPLFNVAPPVLRSCAHLAEQPLAAEWMQSSAPALPLVPPDTVQAPALIKEESRGWISVTSLFSAGLLCFRGESPASRLWLFSPHQPRRAARWRSSLMDKRRPSISRSFMRHL